MYSGHVIGPGGDCLTCAQPVTTEDPVPYLPTEILPAVGTPTPGGGEHHPPHPGEARAAACCPTGHIAYADRTGLGPWYWACRRCPATRVQDDPRWLVT